MVVHLESCFARKCQDTDECRSSVSKIEWENCRKTVSLYKDFTPNKIPN